MMSATILQSHNAISARDADAMSRRGWSFRLGFAALAALAATPAAPLWSLAIWIVLVAVWELWLAPFLTDHLVWPAFARDADVAHGRQTAIVALGAVLFGAFPFLVWWSGQTLGIVLAVAWIGGTAIHVFVYLSNHRAQMIAGAVPPIAAALILPASSLGLTLQTASMSLAIVYLIGAAAVFGFDRNALLVSITRETSARDAAEQTARAKTSFVHALTHHLRTPINHIVGYAGLLEDDIAVGVARAEDAANIAAAGTELLRLVNRALEIAKLQSGAVALDPEPLNAAELLQDAAEQVAPAAARSGNRVAVMACSEEVVMIDRDRVLKSLQCLTENAAQFCSNGIITLSAAYVGGELEFTVADTGVGISADRLAQIEAPLTLTSEDDVDHQQGLGFGLALCRELARALGGTIALQNAPGQGAVARLRVPAPLQNQDAASPDRQRHRDRTLDEPT